MAEVTIKDGELGVFRQETGSTIKTWVYVSFPAECFGESNLPNQTILYVVAKKGKREDNQANRMRAFTDFLQSRVKSHIEWRTELLHSPPHTSDGDLGAFWLATRRMLDDLAKQVLSGDNKTWRELEPLTVAVAWGMRRFTDVLRRAMAHWHDHGFLRWDGNTMPLWNVRNKLDDLCHKVSVDKLHRMHVNYTDNFANNEGARIEISGRNLAQRKKLEAPLQLLRTTFPHLVHYQNPIWTIGAGGNGEGTGMARGWLNNFYDNAGFRLIMGVPINSK